jgi:plasmid segregation protein ParM
VLSKQIGIDIGYGYVKVSDGEKEFFFPSTVGVGTDLMYNSPLVNLKKPTDTMVITVDNKKYFVGELAIRQSTMVSRSMGRNRIEDNSARVLLLSALALYMDHTEQQFNVVTGLPVDYYQQFKDDWAQIMQGTHAVRVGSGSEEKAVLIIIDKIEMIPQPFGTLYDRRLDNEGNLLKDESEDLKVGIVDVGYKTSDLALADGLDFVSKKSISSEFAMSTAYNIIAQRIQEKYKVGKENYELDKVIENGILRVAGVPHDIGEFKKEALSSLANILISEVNSVWDRREIDTIMLTGGGGKAISEYFLPSFEQGYLVNGPQFANVRGYLKLAKALFKTYM